jgi:hypothetical protein
MTPVRKFGKAMVQPVAYMFSWLYGLVALALGVSYIAPMNATISPSIMAIQFVMPLPVWGWLFIGAAVAIFVSQGLKNTCVKSCRQFAHVYAGCVWAAWTGIIITATISGILPAGAPFSTGSFLIGHVILAVHYRSVKIKE